MSVYGIGLRLDTAVEKVTKGFKTIEVDHSNIHDSNGYSLVPSTASVLALNINQTHYILLEQTTGMEEVVHWKENMFVTDGFDIKVRMLEDITIPTTGPIAMSVYNRNRRSTHTSNISLYWTSSNRVADDIWKVGTKVIETFWLNGSSSYGAGPNAQGAEGNSIQLAIEWMLKSTTNYAFEIANAETSCWITPWFYWYEEAS